MSTWKTNREKGLCGRCGKCEPEEGKSRCLTCKEEVNEAHTKWALANPEKDAERKLRWQKRKRATMKTKTKNQKK